ncbi:MAG: sulfite reductase flavoprotein subunit alpha [Pseudomonadota bacterium]
MNTPFIPEEAPFNEDQRAWLAGFMAGMQSRVLAAVEQGAGVGQQTAGAAATPIDILYGTQTGNAEGVAELAGEQFKALGFVPRLHELDAVEMDQLASMRQAVMVVSTYGEGEMPDNGEYFWEQLSATTAPRLEQLKYGVIALGDTSYDEFCQAGKLIDMRLEQLGASRMLDRVDCDVDFEDPSEQWIETALTKFELEEGGEAAVAPIPAAESTPQKSKWNRKNPFGSKMVENRLLSGAGSAKEIRHIAFDLGDSGMEYATGDALGVMPTNSPAIVNAVLERLGTTADQAISGEDLPLGELLAKKLEIRTPSRDLLKGLEPVAKHDELSHVLAHQDKEALEAFLWGKDVLDLLNLNPDLKFDTQEFLSWCKPLQHRAYSISSSPVAHPGEVHLTVAAVRWNTDGRGHEGVASCYLADQCSEASEVPIFMSPNKNFRVPEDGDKPMIMVGPGTGIAPFRAFLEERRERGDGGKNWLFFGDQHREHDFIYQEEIGAASESGLLTRLDLAFSRDQAAKIYVQTRMRENAKELYGWLEEGGYFYVCGDATRMAKDVDQALHDIVQQEGALSDDQTSEYMTALKRDKRYVRDVY